MPVALATLVAHCDALLQSQRFNDYCPNGLQVEGKGHVARLATAVTANQSVLEAAAAWEADALLVHHGYFWRGEAQPIVGMKGRRVATLMGAQMSLLAYHLPLDAHPTLGNNAQWGLQLGIEQQCHLPLVADDPTAVGSRALLGSPRRIGELVTAIERLTGRTPLLIGDADRVITHLAWCTGAAQSYIERAAHAGAELYVSGEVSEATVHAARELDVAYIAAGHHATERYGVQALGASVAEHFALDWIFIDCDNPV